MNTQTNPQTQPVVTMFLKPAFMMTAQSNGLQVAVTLQPTLARPEIRN
jgi:hypothetical protein